MLIMQKNTARTLLVGAISIAFLTVTASVSLAASTTQSGSKFSAQICPDGNPCPAAPAGSIDCTPYAGKTLPRECTLAPGQDDDEGFDTSNLPGIDVVPGLARAATTFNLGPLIAALGDKAALPIFFVDFGDGTGFGSSGNPRALISFPPLHVYVQPGTYTVTGYATFNGRTESTAMSVTVGPAKTADASPAPAATKVESGDWNTTATPTTETVETVGTTTSAGSLSIGAGAAVISQATSKAPAASSAKAPTVSAKANQVVIVSVPSLPSGTDVDGMVKLGNKWVDLPPGEVSANGQLTLPALTFGKAGTYSVKLTLESGAIKYVTVKVKR